MDDSCLITLLVRYSLPRSQPDQLSDENNDASILMVQEAARVATQSGGKVHIILEAVSYK